MPKFGLQTHVKCGGKWKHRSRSSPHPVDAPLPLPAVPTCVGLWEWDFPVQGQGTWASSIKHLPGQHQSLEKGSITITIGLCCSLTFYMSVFPPQEASKSSILKCVIFCTRMAPIGPYIQVFGSKLIGCLGRIRRGGLVEEVRHWT